jgi:hypothetical protein
MFEDMLRAWGVKRSDSWGEIYARRGWAVRPIRWGTSKIDDADINGRLPASCDPAVIAAHRLHLPGCAWSLECGRRSRVVVLDIEDHPLRGQDGFRELRRLGERLGIRGSSMIPLGETPIHSSRSGFGLHVLYAWPGHYVASGVLPDCRFVEIKGDGSSARLPPGAGYAWDINSPFSLALAPLPAWAVLAQPAAPPRGKLRAEAPLGARPHTTLGGIIAGRMVDAIRTEATSTAEVCRRVGGLAWLVDSGRLSEPRARQAIERLAEEIPDLDDSEFDRRSLSRRMLTAFDRRRHHE